MVKANKMVKIVRSLAASYGREDDLEFVQGGSHIKVFLNRKMITILPNGNRTSNGRGIDNNVAEVRRALRHLEEDELNGTGQQKSD